MKARPFLLATAALAALLAGGVQPAFALTFTVNSTADTGDATPEGTCDSGGGVCTLREAIQEANFVAGPDTIGFNISTGTQTISPGSALPTISAAGGAVTIDGTIQDCTPGSDPCIELNGTGAGAGVNGLTISAGGSTVRGLVINRFGGNGIRLQTNGGNTISGNYIGTDVAGTADLGNTADGIIILSASGSNTLGGTTAADRNVISGNNGHGVQIETTAGTQNTIAGNYIGTNKDGAAGPPDLGNSFDGVRISFNSNCVGGTIVASVCTVTAGARNVIADNNSDGIEMAGTGNVVISNYIGTDVNGTADAGNTLDGVFMGGSGHTVGGTTATSGTGPGNVISGNNVSGVQIAGTGTLVTVQGNIIGLRADGDADLGNTGDGVFLNAGAGGNTIGGAVSGARNVISGNDQSGIEATGTNVTGNTIQGNYIGTDITGTLDRGNTGDGIFLNSRSNHTIGGTTADARNVVSGNNSRGIVVLGAAADGNTIRGNYIGTDSSGVGPLGNTSHGIQFSGDDATIGGTAAGEANTIAYNGATGIFGQAGTGNAIRANSIHSNTGLGIDLATGGAPDGVTANDAGDEDTGANNRQNFPVLSAAIKLGGTIRIEGTLNSTASTSFVLDFFANTSCNAGSPNNFGEGLTYLGTSAILGTDVGGNLSFAVTFAQSLALGSVITATATRTAAPLDTSEFSACITVGPMVVDTVSDKSLTTCDASDPADCSLRGAINNANTDAPPLPDTINFDIPGVGPHTIDVGNIPDGALGPLPAVTQPVMIDGTSEPDFAGTPIVELMGTNAGAGAHGLQIGAGGSTVRGLVINRFGAHAIALFTNGGNTIRGNYLGTNFAGNAGLANSGDGVYLDSSDNIIGGTAVGDANLISGNNCDGIGIDTAGAAGNIVQGNRIGTDISGTADLGNVCNGIAINAGSANTVGGTTAAAGNLISGNALAGVNIRGGASSNEVRGNYIGTNSAGTSAVANAGGGVHLEGASSNCIGGAIVLSVCEVTAGARNLISGNTGAGARGIRMTGAGTTSNVVLSNYIGTDATGTAPLANISGVDIDNGASSNRIGGTTAGAGNIISGNSDGVLIKDATTTGNLMQGNYIGTDVSGTMDLGNFFNGVDITNAPGNTVGGGTGTTAGGPCTGACNVISGNNNYGVRLQLSGATDNTIQGNYIGTNFNGTAPIGNSLGGVAIAHPAIINTTIGGTAAEGNLISGNGNIGLYIGSSSNAVYSNYVGTKADGVNPLGNASHGVYINAANNIIGVFNPNTIAYNDGDGVRVNGATAAANRILANSIHSNAGKGIENINGGNAELAPPVITGTGSAAGTVCAFCYVAVYSDNADEGQTFHGLVQDSDGDGNWSFPDPVTGPFVTATAIDSVTFDTSEFSPPCRTLSAGDCDGDGWSDIAEGTIGTDPFDGCADDLLDDAWPVDFDNSGTVTGFDLNAIAQYSGSFVPPAPARRDIAPQPPDGAITGGDLQAEASRIGRVCVP